MYFGDNQGKRTEFAKQAIIRYIWDKNLQEGDRIPAQSALPSAERGKCHDRPRGKEPCQ